VRVLVWEGKPAEAAQALGAFLAEHPGESVERARQLYTLALLQRQAGEVAGAVVTLEKLRSQPPALTWILRRDADLLLAETLLDAGRAADALAVLEGQNVSVSPDEQQRRSVLLARAHSAIGDESAGPAWREVLRHDPSSFEAKVGLAESLLLPVGTSVPVAGPAGTSSAVLGAVLPTDLQARANEAFELAEPVALGLPADDPWAARASTVLDRARSLGAQPTLAPRAALLLRLEGLVDRREFEAAGALLRELRPKELELGARCQFYYLRARVQAGQSEWGAAADGLAEAVSSCDSQPELHAKILFNAGKFAAADGRDPTAVRHFAELERLYPQNSLADDARVRRARSYLEMGSVARFTELLLALPLDYPDGDLTMEGVLDLALYRIERRDWAGAAAVLERGTRAVAPRDRNRGPEESGRERYFWARSLAELGDSSAALDQYEGIVLDLPLSYYMLHAYSRLRAADPARAERALARGLENAERAPFSFPHRPEYDTPEFRRGMELLRVGDGVRGRSVLDRVGLTDAADDTLLWGLALLYDRAGEVQVAHGIARGRLSDWLGHYPGGDWQRPWQIGFPRPYEQIVRKESQKSGVPEWFIYGIMREESTFDASVKSHADAYGLMQLIVPTARAIGAKYGLPSSPDALRRPAINIALGSRVLESLGRQFKENPALAIPGYNAGPGRPRRWLRERPDTDFDLWVELIPIRETRRYTKRVLASRAAYAFLYYRDQADDALRLPLRLTPP